MERIALYHKRLDFSGIAIKITAGLILGVYELFLAISLANLIFSGPLRSDLARGISIALIGASVNILFMVIFSRTDGIIAGAQDNPAVLMAVVAGSFVGTIGAGKDLAATLVTFIFAATLLVGAFFFLLGQFKLGGLARYVPYPVIGGFIAGTGWLIVRGAIGVMADHSLAPENLPALLASDQLLLWAPGVVFGMTIFFGSRIVKHFMTLPVILMGGLIVFYVILALTGTSIDDATNRGLLMGDLGGSGSWRPLTLDEFKQTDWRAIVSQGGNIGAILALSAIGALLNISGLELTFGEDMDLNHELRMVGFSNLISAGAGGMVGYHSLGVTTLGYRMGARSRLFGASVGAVILTTLVAGGSILAYMPKLLLGGILVYIGIGFLNEWVVGGRRKMGRVDYAAVLIILVIIALSGFLVGVGVGLVFMVANFIVNYSRLNLFYRAVSGAEMASNVIRDSYHRKTLTKLGRHVYVLELQGYIFFGTANVILERIRKRCASTEEKPLMYMLLDFRRVTGLDSSAAISFLKVKHLADTRNFTLIFTHLSEERLVELKQNGLEIGNHFMLFPDLDHGLEYCEDDLLKRFAVTQRHLSATLLMQMADNGFNKADAIRLIAYLEQVKLEPGDYLMRQGEESDSLVFIEIGQVSVYLELEDGKRVRLQKQTMGTIVGEVGLYLDVPRSATVIADIHTQAYRLSREALERMKTDDPDLAIAFNAMMVRLVSERLISTNRELAALSG
jgi:SulP family sulfate permease